MEILLLLCTLVVQIGTLEQLTITFRATFGDMVDAIDASLFAALSNLYLLTSLDIKSAGTVSLPCYNLTVLAACGDIDYLKISAIKLGIHQGQILIQVTGRDLLAASIGDKFLLVLELLASSSVINTTYDEATIMAYKVMAVSLAYMGLFRLIVDEATSFDWLDAKNYAVHQTQDIWKASLLSFAPDWFQRDSNQFTNQHGDRISLDEVASGGSFNQLINN